LATNSELLLKRKQQVVQDAIWNAAIDLFGEKGFDETTVDDIVAAAGVSQRTFFRYFASKSDLMGQGVLVYGEALREAIKACPKSADAFDVLRSAVLEIATIVASIPRTRDVIAISIKCPAAREAQRSRMGEVEEKVAQAFASRMKKGRENELNSRLLAGLTLTIVDVTMRLWFADGARDVTAIADQVMKKLCSLVAAA
jgi:AcrR family transcriptional regulator